MTTPDTAVTPLIQAQDLHLHFGGLAALSGVRFDIFPGEIVALIGSQWRGQNQRAELPQWFLSASTRSHLF